MAQRYSKVSVPTALVERLRVLVAERPEMGYRSASDAVTECLRDRIQRLSGPPR